MNKWCENKDYSLLGMAGMFRAGCVERGRVVKELINTLHYYTDDKREPFHNQLNYLHITVPVIMHISVFSSMN